MIDLTVIIVNWNTKKLLQACLNSVLQKTRGIKYEIIVVDNGSTDGSAALVRQFKKVKLVANKKNLGFAAANNQAIKKARGEYLVLLNSDTLLENNALKKLVDFARSKPRLGILGAKLINPGNRVQCSTGRFYTLPVVALSLFGADRWLRRAPQKACRVDWVEGSCFLINRRVLEEIGLLDEKFFMYVEEMEFCYRAKKAGWQTWYYPKAKVLHLVRGSTPESKQKAINWIHEGLQYFYQKHFSRFQQAVLKYLLRLKELKN